VAGNGSYGARGWTARAPSALLLIALEITFFGGPWSEGFDRLWHAHFLLDVGLPELGGLAAFWTIGLARQLASPIYDT